MKDTLKEFIVSSWLDAGIDYEKAKEYIKSAELHKIAAGDSLGFISDTLFKTGPILSFGIPMVGAGLVAYLQSLGETRKKLMSDRIDLLNEYKDEALEKYDIDKARDRWLEEQKRKKKNVRSLTSDESNVEQKEDIGI